MPAIRRNQSRSATQVLRPVSLQPVSIRILELGDKVLRDCQQQATAAAGMIEENAAIKCVDKKIRRRLDKERRKSGRARVNGSHDFPEPWVIQAKGTPNAPVNFIRTEFAVCDFYIRLFLSATGEDDTAKDSYVNMARDAYDVIVRFLPRLELSHTGLETSQRRLASLRARLQAILPTEKF